MLRKIVFGLFIATGFGATGCINQYAGDPVVRTDQLMNQSEDLRQIKDTWRRFWFNDMPSHMTVERIHGGIM